MNWMSWWLTRLEKTSAVPVWTPTSPAGRGRDAGPWEFNAPKVARIVTNRIAPESHGNAVGMGCADFTTQALLQSIDFEVTFANQIASCVPENAFTPVALPTEADALRAAIVTSRCPDWSKARVVRIQDTLPSG